MPNKILIMVLLFASSCSTGQKYQHFTTPTPLPEEHTLILGFLGGRQPWNSPKEGVRKLALELRRMEEARVYVETVENKKRHLAIQLIRNALDRNKDGELQEAERTSARLILYGQSFGGAAVVKLAKQLHKLQIPVLLTIQIDSVGRHDHVIPSNVRKAANLYQREGELIQGEPKIKADNPKSTKIIGNFRFDYKDNRIDISGVPWWKKLFRKAHTKMNYDPDVWQKVKNLIVAELK